MSSLISVSIILSIFSNELFRDDTVALRAVVLLFPVELELRRTLILHLAEQAVIHRTDDDSRDFRAQREHGGQPPLPPSVERGRHINDGVTALTDVGDEFAPDRRRIGRLAVVLAGVEMDDGRAGLGGGDRLVGDFLRRHGRLGDMARDSEEPVAAQVMMVFMGSPPEFR